MTSLKPRIVAHSPEQSSGGFAKFVKDTVAGTCGKDLLLTTFAYRSEGASTAQELALRIRPLFASSYSLLDQRLTTPLAAGGVVVTFVGHPFDTVKVRLQTQSATNPTYCKALLFLPR